MSTPPGPSPLATPLAWNLVSSGYVQDNLGHFVAYSKDALDLAQVDANDRVLDVAAGPGSLVIQAAQRVSEVHALDFSSEMLAHLNARAAEARLGNVVAREGDGQALPYADASFTAAFSMFGLIFFPDRARGLRELARVLRPGGRVVISSWQPMTRVPLLVSVFEALAAELPSMPFGDGKGPLSDPEDLRRELREAGFRAVEIVERTHALEMPDIETLWASMRRSLAPLVLLEHRMGSEAFAPIAAGMGQRLRERYSGGALKIDMPAWLGLGHKPA
jgi:ubiquinone/menaquinone biosynthesis C-methylase UbiE